MADIIKIQYIFSEETKHGQYNDALYFTQTEFENITQDEIDALKKERISKWVEYLDNPVIANEPTKEELQAQYDARELEQQILKARIEAIVTSIL